MIKIPAQLTAYLLMKIFHNSSKKFGHIWGYGLLFFKTISPQRGTERCRPHEGSRKKTAEINNLDAPQPTV